MGLRISVYVPSLERCLFLSVLHVAERRRIPGQEALISSVRIEYDYSSFKSVSTCSHSDVSVDRPSKIFRR